MPITEIKAQIEIPEGFEFDRFDTKITDNDYDYSGNAFKYTGDFFVRPQIILCKVEPKKPAYRVYIEPSNKHPSIVLRSTYDVDYKSYDGKVEWISDWIEYDKPKEWPTPLVERIAATDLEAAQWIVDHWDDLLEDKYTYKNNYSRDCDTLTHMFDWETPPQGTDYWESISAKLGE